MPDPYSRTVVMLGRSVRSRRSPAASVIVLGDLVLDVVLTPERPLATGTDVPGSVQLRQGGSAATTARWLARLGARTTLICSVGRDAPGRSLVRRLAGDGVGVHAVRVAGSRTGRIGVLVMPDGERSFVADRGAADRLQPADLRDEWFVRADLLHLPAYSLLRKPLADAALDAVTRTRRQGGLVTVDLASVGPLIERGRRAVEATIAGIEPDVLFGTADEARVLQPGRSVETLLDHSPVVVVKRGMHGATLLARGDGAANVLRFDIATRSVRATDTTGAGDAFDAGFLTAWLDARRTGSPLPSALRRAAVAGHRAATRQLTSPRTELVLA